MNIHEGEYPFGNKGDDDHMSDHPSHITSEDINEDSSHMHLTRDDTTIDEKDTPVDDAEEYVSEDYVIIQGAVEKDSSVGKYDIAPGEVNGDYVIFPAGEVTGDSSVGKYDFLPAEATEDSSVRKYAFRPLAGEDDEGAAGDDE